MNHVNPLARLSTLSYFTKETLAQLVDLNNNSLYAAIKRWLGNGRIVQLKKGLYVTEQYLHSLRDDDAYAEFMANTLREPSYLSLEYVLQKHSILTEAALAYTSISRKTTRQYSNRLGLFLYRNMKEPLFTGFVPRARSGFEWYEATMAKALFDYLYLKLLRIQAFDQALLQSYRFNLDHFPVKAMKEFEGYCQLTGIKKFQQLPNILGAAYDRPQT